MLFRIFFAGVLWLALIVELPGAVAQQPGSRGFAQYQNCESCIDAGYGWSLKRKKCGMFRNMQCGQQNLRPPAPPPRAVRPKSVPPENIDYVERIKMIFQANAAPEGQLERKLAQFRNHERELYRDLIKRGLGDALGYR